MGEQQSLVSARGGDGKPSAAILPRRRNTTPIVCAIKLSASCNRPPMLCQINGNALAIVYLKTAGGRWEKVRYLRLSWKRSLRPCREAGGEVGEPVGRADWISPQRSPGSPAPDNGRAAGVVKIACWATYWAWLASIRTKSVRIDALDLTLLRAFHNARPCPTLSRLRTQCAEPHLRIGPRPTEDPPCIPSSCRTLAS